MFLSSLMFSFTTEIQLKQLQTSVEKERAEKEELQILFESYEDNVS